MRETTERSLRGSAEFAALLAETGAAPGSLAFGPRVNGGVYNCRRNVGLRAQWVALGLSPGNATPVATDFRLIYRELFTKLFGLSPTALMNVIPNYTPTPFLCCFN